MLCVIDPSLGGVLALGDRGTGKTTTVRGLASLLPPIQAVKGCRYLCAPDSTAGLCENCGEGSERSVATVPVPVVDLPLGATEDRVLGALDIERALVCVRQEARLKHLLTAHQSPLDIKRAKNTILRCP
ncbi:MAG: hypothetical protein AAFO73_12720, partial [Pseudomonadota bacterium]